MMNPSGQESPERLAEAVKKEGSKIEGHPGILEVYNLPLKPHPMNVEECMRFTFGKDSNSKRNRTIMVLGATGAGKSTLVNGMINYILGVTWDDTFRFKLVNEGTAKSQAHSQTSEVTVYKLNHREGFQIDYSLTIVDTPGFGDTRGIERDKKIISQLETLFSAKLGVSDIDAICFVAQASLARLTPTQKYVFDSVLSIFGKDVADNIRILVTFSDGQHCQILDAINESGVPCPKRKDGLPIHFKFNNSALFADNKVPDAKGEADNDDDEDEDDDEEDEDEDEDEDDEDEDEDDEDEDEDEDDDEDEDEDEDDGDVVGEFDKRFWAMGTNSMKKFFSALNVIETKSLTLTQEVLRQRAQLETCIENLQIKMKLGLDKLEEIKQESQILQKHEAVITVNANFQYEISIKKPVQFDISNTGKYITNCQQCQTTCHFPCAIPNDANKRKCAAIGPDGNCKQCKNKCPWNVHFNQKYKWVYNQVTEKRNYQDLKDKYQNAEKDIKSVNDIIRQMKKEHASLEEDVLILMDDSVQCLNTLKEIALKPNPLSTLEYIDLLIEGEKSEGQTGFQERITKLQGMRKMWELKEKLAKGRI
ncbi:uncharacterized protein LOC132462537 [Gadus macrocephalus]|uniref:uncharacterized protein LOC132462537 n=1 Tax=Gadus macrocephalus TaxID=80720 RepID=UPI0028CB2EBA|nr:uncharacterized protein LOC132462537 [Gadus macrocephalus]